jgi:hypothetical protein
MKKSSVTIDSKLSKSLSNTSKKELNESITSFSEIFVGL